MGLDLSKYGIKAKKVYHNPSVAKLYELGMQRDDCFIADNGAMVAYSGEKTGRSPKEKRTVEEETSKDNIWWGDINIPISETSNQILKDLTICALNDRQDYILVVDGFAGWDPKYRIKCRIICTLPYHALFMYNMLIRPTDKEMADFGEPEWILFNGGHMKTSPNIPGTGNDVSVNINYKKRELIILGSLYAGEMKKGIFTVMNYVLPLQGVLGMHCSSNEDDDGNVALFFGLSGTGKTTLSADSKRHLIGDDEHGWSEDGVFNFEGGCYAKTINLSAEKEPQIYKAIKYGSVLENVVIDEKTHEVDWDDNSITENTRVSYPVEYIENAKIPCVGGHPTNIIFLTCDAFGVLPPISRLTPGQAMYHFISGYTAKVAGTEVGVTEPQPNFSACFGAAFLVWHPTKYAELLAEKMKQHKANVWLINTGWTGGSYGEGHRFALKYTRAIVEAALNGDLDNVEYEMDEVFGLSMPKECPNVPSKVLNPKKTWADPKKYDDTAEKLAGMFRKNFEKYADQASREILEGGPKVHV